MSVRYVMTCVLFSSITRSVVAFVGFPLGSVGLCPYKRHLDLPSSTAKLCPYKRHMVSTYSPPDVDVQAKEDYISQAYGLPKTPQFLPWSASINPSRDLSYMPMYQMQLDLIKEMKMEQIELPETFVHRDSTSKPARIGNAEFKNDQFRKIRMTYFDGGDNVQVFNSLWYPSYEYDVPMFGIDLISLGKSRVLSVIDFQPIHPDAEYSEKYISNMTDVKAKYPDLQGVLSGKIYDDTSFFSKNMLFGRFTDESKVQSQVLPAFKDYLHGYVDLMNKAQPDYNHESMEIVKNRQAAYDQYSALKDPAVGLFDAYFGKEWSAAFVHDYLFSFSSLETNEALKALSDAKKALEK